MGRKNKRISKGIDKNFEKFVKSFMSEQKDEIKKEPNHKVFMNMNNSKKESDYHNYNNRLTNDKKYNSTKDNNNFDVVDIKKRNKERLEYAKQQLELNNIQYHVIDEEKTFIECKRISDNSWLKYYASSGCILGYPDFRGIKSLIMLLKQN
jgi:hypothetical protein